MRLRGTILVCVLAGLCIVGGWLVYGPAVTSFFKTVMEFAGPIGGMNSLKQPVSDKRRYAPYVVLVPSNPLPEQASQQDKTPEPPRAKQAKARALVPASGENRKPEPDTPVKEVSDKHPDKQEAATSDFARQVLKAVQSETGRAPTPAPEPKPSVTASTEEPEAKEPLPPPASVEPKPRASTAPKPPESPAPKAPARQTEASAATTPVPAPKRTPAAQQQAAKEPASPVSKRGETKLQYEREVARRPDENKNKLTADKTVRFRKVVPLGPGRLKAGGQQVTLAGVDALGADATCVYDTGKSWDCGRWGTFALRRLIRARSVVCDLTEVVSDSEAVGECTVGRTEINRWVIRSGWGRPTSTTLETYAEDFKKAKTEQRGQWSKDPDSAS